MLRSRLLRHTSVAAVLASTVLASGALAQEAPQTSDDDVASLDEVVVTAERRESSAQRTPVAIAVFSQETLTKNGIGDVAGLATISPSLNIGASSGATFIAVRGVASRDFTEIGDSAIAVSVDDIYLQRPTGINAGFYDLERIEVLRGPQGTLYGRNATGGAVNILTKKPGFDNSGYVNAEIGNYDTIALDGAVNLPLGENLAGRISGVRRYNEGYRDNGPAGRGDDTDVWGVRGQLLYNPTDRLTLTGGVDFMSQGGTGTVYDGVPITIVGGAVITTPRTDADDTEAFDLNYAGAYDVDILRLTGRATYNFDKATLTYIAGYVEQDLYHSWDNDGRPDRSFVYTRAELSKDYSHELRLASANSTGFVWQVGAYYFKEDLALDNYFDLHPRGPLINVREYHYDVETESKALFGQASYDLTDALRVTGGLRYTEDGKSRVGESFVGALNQDVTDGVAERAYATDNTQATWDQTTWHVGVDYRMSPQNLLYGKVSTGYKSGGFNNFGLGAYDPETLTSYEIGSKNRFMDNALQVNLSAFFYQYQDQQVSQFDAASASTVIVNAGESEIKGIELETVAALSPSDRLDFAVTYLDAEYTDFRVANGASNLDLSGNSLIQTPDWAIIAGYEHAFLLPSGELTARIQSQYQSEQWMSFYNRASEYQEAYTRTDLSLSYAPDAYPVTIQAYVRNLENSVVLTEASLNTGIYSAIRSQYAPPRTYGVRATYRW